MRNIYLFILAGIMMTQVACQNNMASIQRLDALNNQLSGAQNDEEKVAIANKLVQEVDDKELEVEVNYETLNEKIDRLGNLDFSSSEFSEGDENQKALSKLNNLSADSSEAVAESLSGAAVFTVISSALDKVTTSVHLIKEQINTSKLGLALIKSKLDPNSSNYDKYADKIDSLIERLDSVLDKIERTKAKVLEVIHRVQNSLNKRLYKLNPLNPLHIPLVLIGQYIKKKVDAIEEKVAAI